MTRAFLLALALTTPLVASLRAQDKPKLQTSPDAPTISQHEPLVLVPVVVRDHKGNLLPGLTKDDFSLQVGGKDQPIRLYDHAGDDPLTLGLLVDVSRSQQSTLDETRSASADFLKTFLRAPDQAFVIHFAHQIEMLHDVTADKAKLDRAVTAIGSESPTFTTHTEEGSEDSEGRRIRGKGTSLYDALFLASDEVLATQKHRKVLVVVTDGIDAGSKESLSDTIETAQRNDAIIYAIYIKGHEEIQRGERGNSRQGGNSGGGYPGGGGSRMPTGTGGYPGSPGAGGGQGGGNNPNGGQRPGNTPPKSNINGKQLLERICGETGGHVFEINRKDPIAEAFTRIGEELRAQDRIGFIPDATLRSGYHQIDLRLAGGKSKDKPDIQARDGFYTSK